MKKQITFLILILVMVMVVAGCEKEKSQLENSQKINNQSRVNQQEQETISPEILNNDVDTNDWIGYRSDLYGYSFKLPENFVFFDEYHGKEIEYNPKDNFFMIEKNNSDDSLNRLGLLITQKDMDKFIFDYNKESKQENGIVKLFEKNGIGFYDKKQNSKYPFPSILNHDSLTIEIDGNIQENYLKAIIASIKFSNKEIGNY